MNRLYEFGPFFLDSRNGLLRRGAEEIQLTAKAFMTLLLLVENAGVLVTKQELLERVWPESFVEPANVTQTVYVLRKLLGGSATHGSYISTVPGRGYRFVAPVRVIDAAMTSPPTPNRSTWDRISPRPAFATAAALLILLLAVVLNSSTPNSESKPSVSPAAQRYYVLGRHYWSQHTKAGLKAGLRYFEAALKLSPNYAQAYSGLSDSYVLLGFYSPSKAERERNYDLALAAARTGIAIDPSVAEPHGSLGRVLMERSDKKFDNEAESEYKTAIALDPNYASVRQWYSWFLLARGRKEQALEQISRAHNLDPLSPIINFALGSQLYWLHKYAASSTQWHQTIALDPNSVESYYGAGLADEQLGNKQTALKEFHKALALSPQDPDIIGAIAYVYAASRDAESATRLMNRIVRLRPVSAYNLALINIALGHRDKALRWLVVAKATHDSNIDWLYNDPRMASIQGDFKRKIAYKTS